MANVELECIATIIDEGTLTPFLRRGLQQVHFVDIEARMIYEYLLDYFNNPETKGELPHLGAIERKFPGVHIPPMDPDRTPEGAVFEVKQHYREACIAEMFDRVAEIMDARPDDALRYLYEQSKALVLEAGEDSDDMSMAAGVIEMKNDYDRKGDQISGIPFPPEWGFTDADGKPIIDKETGRQDHPLNNDSDGIQPTDMIYFYGRPGSMKSWLLANMVASCHEDYNLRCLVISKELSHKEMMERIICMILGLNYTRYRHRRLDPAEYKDFKDLSDYLADTVDNPTARDNRLLISSSTDWNGGDDLSVFNQKVEIFEPNIIFVDSAYLTRIGGEFASAKHTSTQHVAYSFKQLVREMGIPIIANGQANREGETLQGESTKEIADGDGWARASDMVLRIMNTPEDAKNAIYNLLIRLAKGRNITHPGFSLTVQMGNMVKLHEAYESQNQISAKLKAMEKISKMERDQYENEFMERHPVAQNRRIGLSSVGIGKQRDRVAAKGGKTNVVGFPTRR